MIILIWVKVGERVESIRSSSFLERESLMWPKQILTSHTITKVALVMSMGDTIVMLIRNIIEGLSRWCIQSTDIAVCFRNMYEQ